MSVSIAQSPIPLEVSHLSVHYGRHAALDDVTFRVGRGVRAAVVGPNGAGKSTLFKAIVGQLRPSRGDVLLFGRPLQEGTARVAYVPQREAVDWRFPVTVFDVVMMGRYGRTGWFRRPTAEDVAAVRRSLEQLGLAALARRPIGDLSGGQQQRVFLARAMAQEPEILLLDEPFTGVDTVTQDATMELLDVLRREGVTALISTHDLNMAARCDEVLLLNQRLMACGPVDQVFTPSLLRAAFGGQVLVLEETIR